jgi:CRP-like cAMP-binding protein
MGMLLPTFIVGVGGSAGALNAYKALLDALPPNTGMAFLLLSSVNPTASSQLADILSRHTKMEVRVASMEMPIRRNSVYVIPPNANLLIDKYAFKAVSPQITRSNPLDLFLISLAEAMGERAIGIILSGYGRDGADGCKYIKARGGIVFAQDTSAEVDGMPLSAQASGCVDFVLSPSRIADELRVLVRSSKKRSAARTRKKQEAEAGVPEAPAPYNNALLAAFPVEVQIRLFPHLELTRMPLGKVLSGSGDILRYVYFPTDSIVSLLHVMGDGDSSEVAVVGADGVVGIALFMGGESALSQAVVQSDGFAYRLMGQRLKDEFNRHGQLMLLLLRYTQALITQMTQMAACNLHHSIDQRLCRCLLLRLDRLPGNKLAMTQELLSNILGVRREGITEAAGRLLRLGVINYTRGHIEVLDRRKLETLSCECYAVIKKETDRLLLT